MPGETCRVCGKPVETMAQKGTGLCGQVCERRERDMQEGWDDRPDPQGSADLANAVEPA
jgi:hypothetical protein